MPRILIVDDEPTICWALRESLGDEGFAVDVVASAEEGLASASRSRPDAVLLDVRLPRLDGLSAMRQFRERVGSAPIIVMTAFGNLDTAVRAVEQGAFDYLVKPFDLDQALQVVRRAVATAVQPAATQCNSAAEPNHTLIGSSAAMQQVFKQVALVAGSDVSVLITGESGTGKELVARAIHRHSPRRDGPYLPIHLAALSPSLVESELFGHVRGAFTGATADRTGLLEQAAGGTVLLDEIAEATTDLQVKLLRAIEHREITPVGDARPRSTDIRVLAATNRDLPTLIAGGRFRSDLFFRLSVFHIHLPPLRERRDDIRELAEFFLSQTRLSSEPVRCHLSDAAVAELGRRDWFGNVRELRNAVEHAAIVAREGAILTEHLPAPAPIPSPIAAAAGTAPPADELANQIARWVEQTAASLRDARADPTDSRMYEQFLQLVEPPLLEAILNRCDHNRAAAAELLGVHRATLRQKLRRYGLT
jgi:two-component system nitrogen regulation response regulator GlnG